MTKGKRGKRCGSPHRHDLLDQIEGMLPQAREIAAALNNARAREHLDALDRLRLRIVSTRISWGDACAALDNARNRQRAFSALVTQRGHAGRGPGATGDGSRVDVAPSAARPRPEQAAPQVRVFRYEPTNIVGSAPPPSSERWVPNPRRSFYIPADDSEMQARRRAAAEMLHAAPSAHRHRALAAVGRRHRDAHRHLLDMVVRDCRITPGADIESILDQIVTRLTSTEKPPRHELGTEIPRLFPNHTWNGPNRIAPGTRDLWRQDQYRAR